MSKRRNGSPQSRYRRRIILLALLVGVTVLHVWKKVEISSVARQIDRVEKGVETLEIERSKLMAAIVFKKKPGAIERIARGQLGMVYPAGQLTELTYDTRRNGEVE